MNTEEITPPTTIPKNYRGYAFILLRLCDGRAGAVETEPLGTLTEPRDVEDIRRMISERAKDHQTAKHVRHARKVVVVGIVSESELSEDPRRSKEFLHADWCREGGKNGFRSSPVEVGQQFPSAMAASVHLGLMHNEVAQYLSRQNLRQDIPQDEKKTVVVRGVELGYLDVVYSNA